MGVALIRFRIQFLEELDVSGNNLGSLEEILKLKPLDQLATLRIHPNGLCKVSLRLRVAV